MRRAGFLVAALFVMTCSSGDGVKVHRPLGGFPEEPSTVIAVVTSLNIEQGILRVNVKSVDGESRNRGDSVWIDDKTIFTNSGGGPDLRSWVDLQGAELEIKGWYREDRYYADSIDVLGVPGAVERSVYPGSTPPGRGGSTLPTPVPTP